MKEKDYIVKLSFEKKGRSLNMKPLKSLVLSLTIAALLSVIPAQAVKPTQNLASAQKVS
jgi:hypothetical protein